MLELREQQRRLSIFRRFAERVLIIELDQDIRKEIMEVTGDFEASENL